MSADCNHDICLDEPGCLLLEPAPMCDVCDEPIAFMVYAAYDIDTPKGAIVDHPHPRVARYPGAMFRSCAGCLAGLIRADVRKPIATGQYVVKAVK